MTNKQQTKEQDDDYPLSREEFLEEYTRLEQAVKVIQDINRRSQEEFTVRGIDDRSHKPYSERRSIAELYSSYQPTVYQQARKRFIDTIANRDGTFRTLENLISTGTVTEEELQYFPKQKLPRREITSIRRIKTNEGEYILRNETWYGITASGGIAHKDVLLGGFKVLSEKGIRITSYSETLPKSGHTTTYNKNSGSTYNNTTNKVRKTPGPMRGNKEGDNDETTE